jgi:small subunit ribosomal protein S17
MEIIKKRKIGSVVSDKMDKTVLVNIERFCNHPIYLKKFRQSNKIKAHDEKNEYKIGDIVEIEETKPISKDKSWRVTKKIEDKKNK